MDKLNEIKLKHLISKYGDITKENALSCAIEAERTCKDLGCHDPAYVHFIQQRMDYEKLAYLLELKDI